MSYDQLVQLYFERSNALQQYWTLYVVVIGGLLAFSSLRKQPDVITATLVTVLFCCFAYKNLDAIHDVTVQRLATLQAIKMSPWPIETPTEVHAPDGTVTEVQTPNIHATLEATLNPPEYDGVRNFHVASDLLTIAALWAMELRRWRTPKPTTRG